MLYVFVLLSLFIYVSTCIKKFGCKDFGAPKIKFGFTAQKIHMEMRRRLMYCGNRSGDLSIYYSGVTAELFALMFTNKLTN